MLWRASLVFRSQLDKSTSKCPTMSESPVQIQVEVVGLALFHWQWPPFAMVLFDFHVCFIYLLFVCLFGFSHATRTACSWVVLDAVLILGTSFFSSFFLCFHKTTAPSFLPNFVALFCWLILFIASVRVKYCKLWIHWHRICRQACSALFLSPGTNLSGILWNVNKIIKLWEICQLLYEWLTCAIPSDDKGEIMTVWRRRILEDTHTFLWGLYVTSSRLVSVHMFTNTTQRTDCKSFMCSREAESKS